MGRREESVAYNETVFRKANEDLRDEWRRMGIERAAEALFICECGDPACKRPMQLRLADYEAVREDPNTFAVVPGHEDKATEQIVTDELVQRNDRFAVVRKRVAFRQDTEATDPRR
ncbi:MAG: hypothetical protein ICV59_06060 [Thermoleophilia bacterium]|nr:hypothetical protein [Thermoleophilia bacterium]